MSDGRLLNCVCNETGVSGAAAFHTRNVYIVWRVAAAIVYFRGDVSGHIIIAQRQRANFPASSSTPIALKYSCVSHIEFVINSMLPVQFALS